MVNMSFDIANNILSFIATAIGIFIVLGGIVYRYANLNGRVKTLEDGAVRMERDHKEFKVSMENETRKVEGKLDALQVTLGQLIESNAAFRAELRVRFEKSS